MIGSATGSYTYDKGEYAGWTTIQGGTTPEYANGGQSPVSDVIQVRGKVYLYSIAAPSTVNIVLGNNTLNGVEIIKLTDASDTTSKIDFTYGTTPSGTVNIKLGGNTLVGVNEILVRGTDNISKSYGYVPSGISFTLAGDTYQAGVDMTWAQWCASSYNTINAYNDGTMIWEYSGSDMALRVGDVGSSYVSPTETITAKGTYSWRHYSG